MTHENAIVNDPLRMQVSKETLKVFQDDFVIMALKRKYIQEVMDLLIRGDLFVERLVLESHEEDLTPDVEAVKDQIPSLQDLIRQHWAEVSIKGNEHKLMFLPWTDDDGSTQFMVEMARFPEKKKPSKVASLTQWQIPIVVRMLRKVMEEK